MLKVMSAPTKPKVDAYAHTSPMRVFVLGLGLELEPSRAYGWVGISQIYI